MEDQRDDDSVVDSLESEYDRPLPEIGGPKTLGDCRPNESELEGAAKDIQSMTPGEIAGFLKEKGIPSEFCAIFEGKGVMVSKKCVCDYVFVCPSF